MKINKKITVLVIFNLIFAGVAYALYLGKQQLVEEKKALTEQLSRVKKQNTRLLNKVAQLNIGVVARANQSSAQTKQQALARERRAKIKAGLNAYYQQKQKTLSSH